MSEVLVTSKTHICSTNDTFVIRYGQLEKRPYTLIIHLDDNGSDDGSYSVTARPQGSSVTPVAIPYQSLHLNGSAGTGALVTTAITTDSMIAVEADGLEVCLVRSGGAAGSSTLTLGFASLAS